VPAVPSARRCRRWCRPLAERVRLSLSPCHRRLRALERSGAITGHHAQRLFGDPDYLLRVVARDLPAYTQLYDEHLAALPGVLRLNSTLVMKGIVEARPLPF
jgi:DNA-binding Lrp family transcriptional regulator